MKNKDYIANASMILIALPLLALSMFIIYQTIGYLFNTSIPLATGFVSITIGTLLALLISENK